jgi:two-component sensor histidine kinase
MYTIDDEVDLLEELDNISKIHLLQRDDIDELMLQFSTRIAKTLRIERISAWLLNKHKTALISVGEYDTRTKAMKRETILKKEDYPLYFEGLVENKIIIAPNIYTNELTREFTKAYSIPNEIISLLDIPLRINGKLIGVMCFEKTGMKEKFFTPSEQSFAFSCATVFASTMEARKRRAVQVKLDQALLEKDMLMREMNHRINNNFGILISLIRLKKTEPIGVELSDFLNEYEQRIQSIKKIHDLLIQTNSYTTVNLSDYMSELLTEFKNSYPEIGEQLTDVIEFSELQVASKIAMNLGLITSEILINSLKYSLHKSEKNAVLLTFKISLSNQLELTISDSGAKFDFDAPKYNQKLGLSIIRELAENLGMQATFPNESNGTYHFTLNL